MSGISDEDRAMSAGPVPQVCYLPDCIAPPKWAVTDLAGQGQLGACTDHLPRLASRKMRRINRLGGDQRVIVSPLFEVDHVSQLAPLVAVGSEVYGLVANRELAERVDKLSITDFAVLVRSYGGHGGTEDENDA